MTDNWTTIGVLVLVLTGVGTTGGWVVRYVLKTTVPSVMSHFTELLKAFREEAKYQREHDIAQRGDTLRIMMAQFARLELLVRKPQATDKELDAVALKALDQLDPLHQPHYGSERRKSGSGAEHRMEFRTEAEKRAKSG